MRSESNSFEDGHIFSFSSIFNVIGMIDYYKKIVGVERREGTFFLAVFPVLSILLQSIIIIVKKRLR